ncbi:MAG: hypothetical protein MUE60_03060 [Candidatus Eisenbacteria bacterium]|jgi:hypothetical protein|nr:hypothetical protein [Candidatus Eisenbacteria bacterium]
MSMHLKLAVKCPACGKSLMHPDVLIDDLPSIHLAVRTAGETGDVYLSQVYGSYAKRFENVADVPGSVTPFCCPHCDASFEAHHPCECGAAMIWVQLTMGGSINFCTRNGCTRHSLEFDDPDEAFILFQSQDETGLG